MDGKPVTVVNVYGPSSRAARATLFHELALLPPPPGLRIVGGDFNCTLDVELDRSHTTRKSYDSAALVRFLHAWNLIDALTTDMLQATTAAQVAEFRAVHHTYRYAINGIGSASCRLDRWYVTRHHHQQLLSTTVHEPPCASDHDTVVLRFLGNQGNGSSRRSTRSRRRRRQLRFPIPKCAEAVVDSINQEHIEAWRERTTRQADPTLEKEWDAGKTVLRAAALQSIHAAKHIATRVYKMRLKRLRRDLKAAKRYHAAVDDRIQPTVESVTDGFAQLSLDQHGDVERLRKALIDLRYARSQRRRQQKFTQYQGTSPDATRAFYKRLSMKYSTFKAASLPVDPTRPPSQAERLAEDWSHIACGPAPNPHLQDAYFAKLPPRERTPDFSTLCDEFTEAEVLDAIKACPRGKASGPDGIPNDWYQAYSTDLLPVLTQLYNHWFQSGRLPRSFAEATISCIPKTNTPKSGLDYRPIALLNTDYKVYTRLILNRIRPLLNELLEDTQFGFVPDRQVHDAIDIWAAVQRLVADSKAPPTVTALLLDFAKAYDTLDRRFLVLALQRMGFPAHFIAAIEQLHHHTTARYFADGELSRQHKINNGIRQGCPLAPVLFILALNVLYEQVNNTDELKGVALDDNTTVKVAGYADDTALYLRGPTEEAAALKVLDEFGAVSGLKINIAKSQAVCLHPTQRTREHEEMQIPLAAPDQLIRLLGAQVASTPNAAQIWAITLQQLRARLHLAATKTTSATQRATIARTVILPKLLFVGHHTWPATSTCAKLQVFVDNYVWQGLLADDKRHGRAWMSRAAATLPRARGGLQVPNVHAEFQLLSAKRVERWSTPARGIRTLVGRILLQPKTTARLGLPLITRQPGTDRRHGNSISVSGTRVIQQHLAQRHTMTEMGLLKKGYKHVGKTTMRQGWWEADERFYRDYAAHKAHLKELRVHQREAHGRLNRWALFETRIEGTGILLDEDGKAIAAQRFEGLFTSGDRIRDIVDMQWVKGTTMSFKSTQRQFPLPHGKAMAFRRLCDLLIFSYPDLLRPQNDENMLQPTPATLDTWRLHPSATGYELHWEPIASVSINLGTVTSSCAAAKLARPFTADQKIKFDPHPWVDALPPVWTMNGSTRSLKRQVYQQLHEQGNKEVTGRERALSRDHPAIAAALDDLKWTQIARLQHCSQSHQQLLHRIKGGRIGGWDRLHKQRGCPHCPTLGKTGGSMAHVFWVCPMAQRIWSVLRDVWAKLQLWQVEDSEPAFLHAIFSLRLPRVPEGAWAQESTTVRHERSILHELSAVHTALQTAWQQQVTGLFSLIWRWRNGMHEEHTRWTDTQTLALAAGSIRAVARQVQARQQLKSWAHAAAGRLLAATHGGNADGQPHSNTSQPPTSRQRYVLFFDGGSRGNPGPGGSGAIIAATDDTATSFEPIWSACMSYQQPSTTNNTAEYAGVLTGLQAAADNGWKPLEVVGDSLLIIRQLQQYRPPRSDKLKEFYARARLVADKLGVVHWHHHLRAFNKAADAAANIAMDTSASMQVYHPTSRPELQQLPGLLEGDMRHWRDNFYIRILQ